MPRTTVGAHLRRWTVYVHRWLGILLGPLFVAWFISGVVLMYVGMPRLEPADRLARRPVLDFSAAQFGPSDAAALADTTLDGLQLTMVGGRPVYRIRSGARSVAAYADTAARVEIATPADALAEVRTFAPDHAQTLRYEAQLDTPDQWTLEIARQLPLHRVALGDAEDTRVYVSAATGDIVLATTARGRRWAYPGAIVHWLYMTPFRRHTSVWAQFIIWSSLAGTVMAILGLVWGLWRFSPRRTYRLQRVPRQSPYAGWMWLHHYAGLAFGVASVTWVFSGMLSMDPWDWHPSTAPTVEQRRALAGGQIVGGPLSLGDVRAALDAVPGAREAELIRSRGRRWLSTDQGLAAVDDGTATLPLDERAMRELARAAMPEAAVADVERLSAYDAYYYSRDAALPLPVFRVRYDDPQQTWLYVDAARGVALRKEERLTRLNRWLYHGLHSLDFPVLYYRRPLWDLVVIGLSLGGLVLSLAPLAPAFRRIRRQWVRLRSL